jgi:alkylhydroperoxidase/carboxymuconolactone decarboxylase family protein YurZ
MTFVLKNGINNVIYKNQDQKEMNLSDQPSLISNAFQTFMKEAPQHAQARGKMVQGLVNASALDKKTAALAYLAVLASLRLESGNPFHVQTAKQLGTSREEVISVILVGLPAVGHGLTQVLPIAIEAYDANAR